MLHRGFKTPHKSSRPIHDFRRNGHRCQISSTDPSRAARAYVHRSSALLDSRLGGEFHRESVSENPVAIHDAPAVACLLHNANRIA
jgi:hypothetical protein